MALNAYGRAVPGDTSLDVDMPPPSTLAAQLVSNLRSSSSTTSSRPDEITELRTLLPLIEQAKNNPNLVMSPAERIEHNHMLIYVVPRVILDGDKWDDPFADWEHLHKEALKVINCLKITIAETPPVLAYVAKPHAFTSRGPEPLWIWLFPKLFRLLGHPKCQPLAPAIEDLFQSIFSICCQSGKMWSWLQTFSRYMRENYVDICTRLKSHGSSNQRFRVCLPPTVVLAHLVSGPSSLPTAHTTFTINGVSHAQKHAGSLLSILLHPIIASSSPGLEAMPMLWDSVLWLSEAIIIHPVLPRSCLDTHTQHQSSIVKRLVDLLTTIGSFNPLGLDVLIKAHCSLVMCCSKLVTLSQAVPGGHHLTPTTEALSVAFLALIPQASISQAVCTLISTQLAPVLDPILEQVNEIHNDLWMSYNTLKLSMQDEPLQEYPHHLRSCLYKLPSVRHQAQLLRLTYAQEVPKHRDKRRKTVKSKRLTLLHEVTRPLFALLGEPIDQDPDPTALQGLVVNKYPELRDEQRSVLLDGLARVCCAADGTIELQDELHSGASCKPRMVCAACAHVQILDHAFNVDNDNEAGFVHDIKSTILDTFADLIQLPSFTGSKLPRITAMMVLRKVIRHTGHDKQHLSLDTSPLAQWCLNALRSSVRELRIAAGRTLLSFVETVRISTDLKRKNLDTTLQVLRELSATAKSARLTETCIMAWGQVGRLVADGYLDHVAVTEKLNLVLAQLLDYLGHSNPFVSSLAFNELSSLCMASGVPAQRLFEPYWRNLAYSVVKETRTLEQMSKLLHLPPDDFLVSTQRFTLPWLVLKKKVDTVVRISKARGDSAIHYTCLQSENLGPIMALLLIQDVPDVQEHSMTLLRTISDEFEKSSFVDLLGVEPVKIPLELFLMAADGDQRRKQQVRTALTSIATWLNPKAKVSRKQNVIGKHLQHHILGLMALFGARVNTASTVQDKRRIIKGIEEMVRICKSYAKMGRPHIATLLLSYLADAELRSDAVSCWFALISNIGAEDVEVLMETTFFIAVHYFDSLDEESQKTTKEMLQFLLDKHGGLVKSMAHKLPAFPSITALSGIHEVVKGMRPASGIIHQFGWYEDRIQHENSGVVLLGLRELSNFLETDQSFIQLSAISQQPDDIVTSLVRTLLDCAAKYNGAQSEITRICSDCLGKVGCIDFNRVEARRVEPEFVLVANFGDSRESSDFVVFLFEHVLIKTFISTSDSQLHSYLSYALQELLDRCSFKKALDNPEASGAPDMLERWNAMSEGSREVLVPFLSSSYVLAAISRPEVVYPLFSTCRRYYVWLRNFVADLLAHPGHQVAALIFEPLQRLVVVQDVSIAEFLLPYLVLHVVLTGGDTSLAQKAVQELLDILSFNLPQHSTYQERQDMKLFYNAVFRIVDYSMRWQQKWNSYMGQKLSSAFTNVRDGPKHIQAMLDRIEPALFARRAAECNDYPRALFQIELHINHLKEDQRQEQARLGKPPSDFKVPSNILGVLLDVYTNIDDPDGLDGISTRFPALDLNQQILGHRKSGRWAVAQSWYEMKLAEDPADVCTQLDLLSCLKESGQYDILLNYVEGMTVTPETRSSIAPFALEAFWATGRWDSLDRFLDPLSESTRFENFNCGIAEIFRRLRTRPEHEFRNGLELMRDKLAATMTYSTTSSLRTSHDAMLKCHALVDLEMIAGITPGHPKLDHEDLSLRLNQRFEVLGAHIGDRQYLLGIRRAAMQIMQFAKGDIASVWLSSAKLARKTGAIHQAFNAVLHASELGDSSSTLENARLLWKEGHNRKAIQILEGAIASNSLLVKNMPQDTMAVSRSTSNPSNLITAKAHLLLAKWLDASGQAQSSAQRFKYQLAAKTLPTWEKGHYHLGRYYKKLFESEMTLKPEDQTDEYVSGQMTKLVVENYIRALYYGTKYLHQALPRILTLWLDLGASISKAPAGKTSVSAELQTQRQKIVKGLHQYIEKYTSKLPAYVWYTAISQLVSRIAHPNPEVFYILQRIIVKVVEAYPRQALWQLFSLMTFTARPNSDRRQRGNQLLKALKDLKPKTEGGYDMKNFVRMGEKLSGELLKACTAGDFPSNKTMRAGIVRDLNFNHNCTPCPMVVPIEKCLSATLPTLTDTSTLRKHRPFSRDAITINSFLDEVLVLGSLAKPRRITARGSDGRKYHLLLKPTDDLRTDQRLMEFNGIVNKALNRDAESSKRQLYVKTYAVTPLNEECGIIEWVDGLKTLRDILLALYRARGVVPNYGQLGQLMKQAMNEENEDIWKCDVLKQFPPVLQQWFVGQFPSPSLWFAARLRYTRSCAVMSMLGTILGLGDRHGENILLEEGNGGIFHVDFNCMFDKGLTFAQPEKVPFRLTNNMVHAMGVQGYEGAFRATSELTLKILRVQEETLMSILEAFIYDPTLDLQKEDRKKRKGGAAGKQSLQPNRVVESIKRKIGGFMGNDSIALGVEGQVEELIKQAVSPMNLTSMYIGWCPFL